jgi:hypothetical protein
VDVFEVDGLALCAVLRLEEFGVVVRDEFVLFV